MKPLWFKLPETKPDGTDPGDKQARDELAASLDSTIKTIEESASEKTRRDNIVFDLELYYGCRLSSIYDIRIAGYDAQDWQPDNLQYNIVYALVSTVQNRICSFRPRADFVPSGADSKLRRAAKDTRSSCDAWMQEDHVYEERDFMVRDILTSDAGVIKTYEEDGHITARRFPSWEFLVDSRDGRNRRPWCMYHVRWIPLDEALAKYAPDEGDEDSKLDQALRMGVLDSDGLTHGFGYGLGVQMVREVDAYKRSDRNGKNGRRVVMVGRRIVTDAAWKHPDFPMVVKRFDKRSVGYWGVSGINCVRGLQLAINDEMEAIQTAHENASLGVWQVQENETEHKISDAVSRIVKYQNAPHVYTAPAAVSKERYDYIEQMRKIAYEVWGVSQFVASGVKQPGLESAVAIRESTELQSDRLALLAQMNEEIIVEVADWWRKLNEDLGTKSKWKVLDHGMAREVEFQAMGDAAYVRVLPTSLFGQSVAGRVDKAMSYVKEGWLSLQDAMRAVDVPDLDPIVNLELAESNYLESVVDDILEEGIYNTPVDYLDPAKMAVYARKRLFHALTSKIDYPAGHIGLLSKLIDAEEQRAASKQSAGAAPPAAAAPPAPGAAPMPGAPAPAPMPGAPMPAPGGPPALPQ